MRALMTDPDVLLLDEPLGALDPIIRYDLQQELRAIFRQLKKSVLLVTHDLHEADYFGDELVLLRAGHVEQRGSARQLMEQSASDFVAQFVQAQRTSDFGAAP
jgi:osmoprotectant transport system ATP-binding protein